jgi:hypothetical protein
MMRFNPERQELTVFALAVPQFKSAMLYPSILCVILASNRQLH